MSKTSQRIISIGIVILAINILVILILELYNVSLLDSFTGDVQRQSMQLRYSSSGLAAKPNTNTSLGQLLQDYALNLQAAIQRMDRSGNWSLAFNQDRKFISANDNDYFQQLKKYPQIRTILLKFPFEQLHSILPIAEFYDYSASNCTVVEASGRTAEKSVLQLQHNAECQNTTNTLNPIDSSKRLPASLQWGIPPRTALFPEALLSYVNLVPNGYIVNHGIVATSNVTLQMDGCKMLQMSKSFSASKLNPNEFKTVDKVYVIHQFWGEGFFHSSLENLPRLAPLLHFLQVNKDIFIYTFANFNGILTKLLGIDPTRIIKGNVRAKIVILPAGVSCGRPSLLHTQLLWQHYHSSLPLMPAHSRSVIVLIKRSHKGRFFKHHDAILQMLINKSQRLNVSVVVFDDQHLPTLEETVRIFNQAFMVLAPHGAGESNMIYSQPGTVLIEGLCDNPSPNFCYGALSQVLGLRYYAYYRHDKPCQEYTAEELEVPVRFYIQHKHLL